MAEEKHTPKTVTTEALLEEITLWEKHLINLEPKQADSEYGFVIGPLQKIGERCARRRIATTQNKCSICGKPFVNGIPAETVSVWDINAGRFFNQYADSEKCGAKLKEIARRENEKARAA